MPHRDEFSETVGYMIAGNKKKEVFIPDINKWPQWDIGLKTVVEGYDLVLLDGLF